MHGSKSNFKLSEGRPFSPRHQIGPRINGSPVDTLPHSQNGIGPAILVHCEEQAPPLPRSPSGAASLHSDARGQAPENNCVPLIPSQASSTMVSGIPPMPYPPPPPTAFYAPAPWFMPPYPYAPPPHIVPGYPPFPLTSSMVSANEAGHHIPSNTMYQVWILNYNRPHWIADFFCCSQFLITRYTHCPSLHPLQPGSSTLKQWQSAVPLSSQPALLKVNRVLFRFMRLKHLANTWRAPIHNKTHPNMEVATPYCTHRRWSPKQDHRNLGPCTLCTPNPSISSRILGKG